MNKDEWSQQSKEAFELEQVGLLWERIHNANYKLIEVQDLDYDETGFPLKVVFKFEKVIKNG